MIDGENRRLLMLFFSVPSVSLW